MTLHKEERRALASFEDYVDTTIQGCEEYIKKSKERIITTTRNSNTNRNNLRARKKTAK